MTKYSQSLLHKLFPLGNGEEADTLNQSILLNVSNIFLAVEFRLFL